eukprot:evm.model.scf_1269.3 EVM.evm.TU.scf_1269.3   scf_1269:13623-17976(+)
MGISSSRLDKGLTALPDGERYFGLENFGNTCYCNSVLQALYFCQPFRKGVLDYYAQWVEREVEETILTVLGELFQQVRSQKKKSGVLSPKRFVQRLKKENDQFCGYMHQDAHEFLNFLLPKITDILEKEERSRLRAGPNEPVATWLQQIFEGKLVYETRCLQCETVTWTEQSFMDLQLPIEHNWSLTSCLKKYSATSVLSKEDKYFCEVCQCLQEAHRRTKIKHVPQILICHLLRFDPRLRKLMHRVVFPMELKLCITTDDTPESDAVYNLFALVVHSGSSMNHGHYVSLIKSSGHWLLYDDDHVTPIPDSKVQMTFGSHMPYGKNTEHGYILFYERADVRPIRPLPRIPSQASISSSSDVSHNKFRKSPSRTAGISEPLGRTYSEPAPDYLDSGGAAKPPRGASELSRGSSDAGHGMGHEPLQSKSGKSRFGLGYLRGSSKSSSSADGSNHGSEGKGRRHNGLGSQKNPFSKSLSSLGTLQRTS